MSPVSVVDLVGFLAILMALVILWRGWKRALERDAKLLLAGLLALTLFHGFSNILEWSGITKALDPFEDFIQVLEPMLWCFFFYAFLQAVEITERKQAEERLRLLSSAVEQSTEGLAVSDLEGNLLFVNNAFATMHGYTPEELVGKHLSIFHTPEQMPSVEAANRQIRETGEFSGEIWHVRRDGTVLPTLMHNSLVRDEAGNPIGMIGTLRDITEHKRAEEEIGRLAKFPSENPNPVLRIAKDGAIIYANKASLPLLNVWGCQEGQPLPDDWRKFTLGVLSSGLRKDAEVEYEDRVLSLTFAPVVDADYVNVYGLDITERQRAEEALKEYSERLEEMVAERTAELNQRVAEAEQLNRAAGNLLKDLQLANRLSQEAASRIEEVNAELEAFTYSVSHDLRAPLRAMEGFSQALLEDYADRLDPVGQDYARRIAAAAQHMDTLIQDLLAYSRLSRIEIKLRPVGLEGVVQEALSLLTTEIQEKSAQVAVERPLPRLVGHHATLVQVVGNLLSNAIKFVAPGVRPQVRVWAETIADCGLQIADVGSTQQSTVPKSKTCTEPSRSIRNLKWIRLWVEDNGIGIAAEHHELIFRIFERLHGVETYPGTGVGLAIVRKGVERLGGRVGVESEPGRGSRFWVELPKSKT